MQQERPFGAIRLYNWILGKPRSHLFTNVSNINLVPIKSQQAELVSKPGYMKIRSTGCPKKSYKQNAAGAQKAKFSMDMTWECLILLSFSKKRQKKQISKTGCPSWAEIASRKGCRLVMMKQVHHASSSILLETFFEILCLVALAHGCLVLSKTLIVIIQLLLLLMVFIVQLAKKV